MNNEGNIVTDGILMWKTPELWECTSRLRWKDGVLQQLWWEKTVGKYDWRDVPTAEECDIK